MGPNRLSNFIRSLVWLRPSVNTGRGKPHADVKRPVLRATLIKRPQLGISMTFFARRGLEWIETP